MDVLLVEDNPGDVRMAAEAFRGSSRRVDLHVVSDGVEAMVFLRQEGAYIDAPRPNLIILDLNLPKMDGREVLTKIKNDNNLKSIPTLILTSSDAEEDVRFSYENSANCYVTKPKDWDTFKHVVRAVNKLWFALRLPAA
jgi:chemotaxis family two-component system response regulator Rcp1